MQKENRSQIIDMSEVATIETHSGNRWHLQKHFFHGRTPRPSTSVYIERPVYLLGPVAIGQRIMVLK